MAGRSQPVYRLRFFKGSKFVAHKRLRYADSFEIWFGQRRVLLRALFPRMFKKVGDRRDFLESLIRSIETKRQQILTKRRARYRADKEKQYRKKVERRLKRPIPQDAIGIPLAQSLRESQKQLPVFAYTTSLDPGIIRSGAKAKVKDSILIPIAPDGKRYRKQIFDKILVRPDGDRFHIAVLDMTLDRDAYVSMTADSFDESYEKAAVLILPSLLDYFKETRKSSNLYILRLKFLNRWDEDQKYIDHGLSYFRVELREDRQVFHLFRRTFLQLFGAESPQDKDSKGYLRTNYLQGEKKIIITGATFEAMADFDEADDVRKFRKKS